MLGAAMIAGGGLGTLKPKDLPEFKWFNTVPDSLITPLSGALHALMYRTYVSDLSD